MISAPAAKPTATTSCNSTGMYSRIIGSFLRAPLREGASSASTGTGRGGREVHVRGNQRLGQSRGQPAILLASFLDHASRDQILQLFISAQTQHFLTAAGRIPGPQIF